MEGKREMARVDRSALRVEPSRFARPQRPIQPRAAGGRVGGSQIRSLHAVPSLCLLATWLPSFLETEHFLFPFYLQK